MKIPEKFYKYGKHPTVENIGQLKALLAELPDDIPVQSPIGDSPQCVIFNHGKPDMHFQLYEGD